MINKILFIMKILKSCLTLFVRIKPVEYLRERFHIRSRLFQRSTAIEISSPRRRLCERLRRVLVEHLGHHRDQVTDNAVVLDQAFNDRVRQPRLLEIKIFSHSFLQSHRFHHQQ